MKYLKLYESTESYKERIVKTFNKYRADVKVLSDKRYSDLHNISMEFKSSIDDCLYYLTDNFKHEIVFDLGDLYEEDIPNYYISFNLVKSDIDKFEEECRSSIARLDEIGVSYNMSVSYLMLANGGESQTLYIPKDIGNKLDFVFNDMRLTKYPYNYVGVTLSITESPDGDY